MTTYTATAVRSGGWWAIDVPEVKGVHTQAKRLEQVEEMARDAIAGVLAVDPRSFDVDVVPDVPEEVLNAIAARRAAKQADELAERVTATAIAELLKRGLTVRDAGSMLEISPQRVSQIAGGTKRGAKKSAPKRATRRRVTA